MTQKAVLIVTVLLATALSSRPLAGQAELFRLASGRAFDAGVSPAAVDVVPILIDVEQLERGTRSVSFELTRGERVRAQVMRLERRGPRDVTWRGRLIDGTAGRIQLTAKAGAVAGLIETADAVYEIGPTPSGGHQLSRLDQARFSPCAGGVENTLADEASGSSRLAGHESSGLDIGQSIDVMVLYTPQARDASGGLAGIEATAQSAIDLSNTAFVPTNRGE